MKKIMFLVFGCVLCSEAVSGSGGGSGLYLDPDSDSEEVVHGGVGPANLTTREKLESELESLEARLLDAQSKKTAVERLNKAKRGMPISSKRGSKKHTSGRETDFKDGIKSLHNEISRLKPAIAALKKRLKPLPKTGK